MRKPPGGVRCIAGILSVRDRRTPRQRCVSAVAPGFSPCNISRVGARGRIAALCLFVGLPAVVPLSSADAIDPVLERQFRSTIRPFLTTYCLGCHGTSAPAAQFDMRPYSTLESVIADLGHWRQMSERLGASQMPPARMPQPPAELRLRVIDWIQAVAMHEARKHAGDPGPVLPRRLSNAEYNNTIRDLTGVDIQPAREFPVDPANTEGFDNSGESLAMSPALFAKYLQAARQVSDHLVLKPDGIRLRAASDAGRNRPRSLCDRAHPGFLRPPAHRLRQLLPRRLAVQASRRARQAPGVARRRRRRSQGERQVSGDDLADSGRADDTRHTRSRTGGDAAGDVACAPGAAREPAGPAPREDASRCASSSVQHPPAHLDAVRGAASSKGCRPDRSRC